MRARRAMALAPAVLLCACLCASRAQAQNNLNLEALGVLLAPPAVAALICDFVTIGTLAGGYAYRGSTITGTVLGGITTLFSLLALGIGLSNPNVLHVWLPASATGLALGVGSVLVNVYGIARPPPPAPERPRQPGDPGGEGRSGARPSPVRLYPVVWADRGGPGAMGALALEL